jgi:hypothetical protein
MGISVRPATPLDQATQKKQLENLLGAALPFAQQMLKEHGEFFPYGETMGPDAKYTSVAGYTGDEHPKSTDVIALLKKGFRKDGAAGKIIASALVYDVRIVPPGCTDKSDAVAIDLNHRNGLSLCMAYPYHIASDKSVVFADGFRIKGTDDIFPQSK